MKPDFLCVGLTALEGVGRPITEIPKDEGAELIEQSAGGDGSGLGLRPGLAGAIGSDLTGKFLPFALEDGGVETSLLQTLEDYLTSTTIFPIDHQGRR